MFEGISIQHRIILWYWIITGLMLLSGILFGKSGSAAKTVTEKKNTYFIALTFQLLLVTLMLWGNSQ